MRKFPFLIFLLVFSGLTLYTALQIARLMPGAAPATVGLTTTLFFWLMLGWQLAYKSASPIVESPAFLWAAWSTSVLSGIWAGFILLSLPLESWCLIRWLCGWGALGLSRPQVLGLLAAASLLAGLGFRQMRAGPLVREVAVPIANLPPEFDGLRIVQISDLHIGPTIRGDFAARVAAAVETLKPDLIAVTGDLADGNPETLAARVHPLSKLRAPLGVYYVTGNHEYYWGAERWIKKAAELGFTPLVNENRVVIHRGAKLMIAGVTDTSADRFIPEHHSDPLRAGQSKEPVACKLLLAHRPESCENAEPAGFDLQLSGHTHGGQFFPFSLIVRLVQRYARGLHHHGRLWLYVNSGTGYWGPPHRFLVPSEITLLRLTHPR